MRRLILTAVDEHGARSPLTFCGWKDGLAQLATRGCGAYVADAQTGLICGEDSCAGITLRLVPNALRRLRRMRARLSLIEDRPYSTCGCCTDRHYRDERLRAGRDASDYGKCCDEHSCMMLPEGQTCATCAHETRCTTIFGAESQNDHCQFFPRRFRRRE